MNVVWHDGKCLLIVDGMSVTQAEEMMAEWQFKECEVVVDSSESSGDKKPLKKEE